MNSSSTPSIRFKEFNSQWEIFNLSDAEFSRGKSITKADLVDDGEVDCILFGQLYTHYNEIILDIISKTNIDESLLVMSEKNDVIVPIDGETHIDIARAACVIKKDVALGGGLTIIKSENDGVFLSYYLNNQMKYKIASLAQGSSVIHLYGKHLKTLKLKLPTILEQEKIASFLSSVELKIEKLTRKKELLEEYKKGVMQKLFRQEIRFKDDNGNDYPEWKEKKLEDVVNRISIRNFQIKSSEIEKFGELKVVDQGKNLVSGFSNQKNKLLLNSGAIVYGDHTTNIKYIDFDFIIGADGVIVFKSLKNDLKYLYYNISYNNIQPEGYKRHYSILKYVVLQLPSFDEQKKIASFLSSLDLKIKSVSSQIDKTKEFKKGLLQQMFV